MRPLGSILFLLFIYSYSFGQNNLSMRALAEQQTKAIEIFKEGAFGEAIPVLEQTTKKYKKTGKAFEFLEGAEVLCLAYEYTGQYDLAIKIKKEQMDIHALRFSDRDGTYAMHLGMLAHLYSIVGEYKTAIEYSDKALALKLEVYGPESEEYKTALLNAAHYHVLIGNYDVVTQYLDSAEELVGRLEGKKSESYAIVLNLIATMTGRLAMYKEALKLEQECYDICQDFKDSQIYPIVLQNLSLYSSLCDNNEKAILYTLEAIDMHKRNKTDDTPNYGVALNNLFTFYIAQKKYKEAEDIGLETLAFFSNKYRNKHEHIAIVLVNLARLYFDKGDMEKSSHFIHQANEYYKKIIFDNFKTLTKSERNYYWIKTMPWFKFELPSYALKSKDNNIVASAYNGILFSKCLLLNSERGMSEFVFSSGNKETIDLYAEIKEINAKITQLSLNNKNENIIEKLVNDAAQKENQLLKLCSEFGDFTEKLNVHWEDIKMSLNSGDVAIEFGKYNDDYYALVLKNTYPFPKLVPIDYKDTYGENQDITSLIWGNLLDELLDANNVYFAADGKLHTLPIESLPIPGSSSLMSDKYKLFRLTSTRELFLKNTNNKPESMVLYGGLDYDCSIEHMVSDALGYRKQLLDSQKIRSLDFSSLLRETVGLSFLEGSKKEVEIISNITEQQHIKTTVFLHEMGTEASFKALNSQRESLLHIATHGYYYSTDDNCMPNNTVLGIITTNDNFNIGYEDKSLLRSGLIMAGAQNILDEIEIPEGIDDGILTAQEISTLDFRGLDLVTLSACETAKGDITGDGVFGLQRGFKKAGANSMLMSLWKVDDEATCKLMTNFYSNWIEKKMSKHSALEAAKRAVRETKGWEDPKYWAAFILLDALD